MKKQTAIFKTLKEELWASCRVFWLPQELGVGGSEKGAKEKPHRIKGKSFFFF